MTHRLTCRDSRGADLQHEAPVALLKQMLLLKLTSMLAFQAVAARAAAAQGSQQGQAAQHMHSATLPNAL